MATDVTSRDDINAMIREAGSRHGPIDIVVHNAGIYPFSPVVKMKEAEWDLVIDTNLKSTFLITKAVLPQMIERRYGRIVVISSISGPKVVIPGASHYGASKAGVNGVIRTMAVEVARQGITVNGVEPGNIIIRAPGTRESRIQEETMKPAVPMGELGTPEDIAWAALYLASDEARYVTGQILPESQNLIPGA